MQKVMKIHQVEIHTNVYEKLGSQVTKYYQRL